MFQLLVLSSISNWVLSIRIPSKNSEYIKILNVENSSSNDNSDKDDDEDTDHIVYYYNMLIVYNILY